jgi:hypothetical protein
LSGEGRRPEAPHAIDDQRRQVLLGYLDRIEEHAERLLQGRLRAAGQSD